MKTTWRDAQRLLLEKKHRALIGEASKDFADAAADVRRVMHVDDQLRSKQEALAREEMDLATHEVIVIENGRVLDAAKADLANAQGALAKAEAALAKADAADNRALWSNKRPQLQAAVAAHRGAVATVAAHRKAVASVKSMLQRDSDTLVRAKLRVTALHRSIADLLGPTRSKVLATLHKTILKLRDLCLAILKDEATRLNRPLRADQADLYRFVAAHAPAPDLPDLAARLAEYLQHLPFAPSTVVTPKVHNNDAVDDCKRDGDLCSPCDRVVRLPQVANQGTCWLNAILTGIFHSQGMRQVLLSSSFPAPPTRSSRRHDAKWLGGRSTPASLAAGQVRDFFRFLLEHYRVHTYDDAMRVYSYLQKHTLGDLIDRLNVVDPVMFPRVTDNSVDDVVHRELIDKGGSLTDYVQGVMRLMGVKEYVLLQATSDDFKRVPTLHYLSRRYSPVDEGAHLRQKEVGPTTKFLVITVRGNRARPTTYLGVAGGGGGGGGGGGRPEVKELEDEEEKKDEEEKEEVELDADTLAYYGIIASNVVLETSGTDSTVDITVPPRRGVGPFVFTVDSTWSLSDTVMGSGHAIAGVTCDGQRYLYNGWTYYGKNPNRKKSHHIPRDGRVVATSSLPRVLKQKGFDVPCPLFRYDWLDPKAESFVLETDACFLLAADPDAQAPQAGKRLLTFEPRAERVYIAVRKDFMAAAALEQRDVQRTAVAAARAARSETEQQVRSAATAVPSHGAPLRPLQPPATQATQAARTRRASGSTGRQPTPPTLPPPVKRGRPGPQTRTAPTSPEDHQPTGHLPTGDLPTGHLPTPPTSSARGHPGPRTRTLRARVATTTMSS
jgi:hypothetical protein